MHSFSLSTRPYQGFERLANNRAILEERRVKRSPSMIHYLGEVNEIFVIVKGYLIVDYDLYQLVITIEFLNVQH